MIRRPAFVGRAAELAALRGVLAGLPAVVVVEGEAGIGKSRLLQELFAAESHQRRCLVAYCPPFLQPHTLGPVSDALRRAAGDVAGLGLSGLAGALRPLFPEWAHALPPAPEPAEDASAARHRVFGALGELLGGLGVGWVAVEDAHWADDATLEFLLYVAAQQPQRFGLVVTYRPGDVVVGSLLSRLAQRGAGDGGLRLTLGPLDVGATAGLMSSMLAGQRVSAEFAAFVHERTDGVPLAIEESVRLMGERADLARHGSGWMRRPLADIAVPATIRDAVLERAGRFDADAQAVLRAAAALAEPAGETTLATVSGLAAEQVSASLCSLLDNGLLADDGHGLVSFRHALAGRAVYEAIQPPQRRILHRRAARAVERLSPHPVAQLARHFREAGDTANWCRYAEQAADRAIASGDEATAAALLCDVTVHAGLPAGDVVRLMKKIPFGSTSEDSRVRDLAGTLRSVLAAGRLAAQDEARVRFQLGRVFTLMDEFDAARAELEQAIPHLAEDPAESARAMILLGWPRGTTWPRSAHLRWLRRAGQVRLPRDAIAARMRLAVDRATGLLLLGEEAGWAEAARIPAGAANAQERNEIVRLCVNIGELAVMWGRYAEARKRLTRGLELAERHQYQGYRDSMLAAKLRLDWLTGAWEALADRARELAGRADQPTARLEATLVTGLLHAAMGSRPHAQQCLGQVLDETLQLGTEDCAMEPAAALAGLHLADGQVAEALKVTDEPAGIVAGKGIWIWATDMAPARVSALLAAGRDGDAAELVTAFARGMRHRDAPAPKAALMVCRAMLAEAHGQRARAATLFGHVAAAWDSLPRPYEALLARERQARCLLGAGHPKAGLALLGQVFDGLTALGARVGAARVLDTLHQHRANVARPWPGRPGYGDRLSPRELDVARLLVAGRSNRQIGQQLFLSPSTVAGHVASAMRKLGVTSRTALAVRVVEDGIIARDLDQVTTRQA